MLEEFEERGARLEELSEVLKSEIAECNRLVKGSEHDDQFKKRTQVRTIFSVIEAYISHLKQSALLFAMDEPETFTSAEQLALVEEESYIHGDGSVRTRRAKINLRTNVKLAFSTFGKACGREYSVDYGDEGGRDFLAAIQIRDRITHPKSAASLTVSDEEAELVIRAWCWFGEHLVAVSRGDR